MRWRKPQRQHPRIRAVHQRHLHPSALRFLEHAVDLNAPVVTADAQSPAVKAAEQMVRGNPPSRHAGLVSKMKAKKRVRHSLGFCACDVRKSPPMGTNRDVVSELLAPEEQKFPEGENSQASPTMSPQQMSSLLSPPSWAGTGVAT